MSRGILKKYLKSVNEEKLAKRFLPGLDDCDNDEHHAEDKERDQGKKRPIDRVTYVKGYVEKSFDEHCPTAECDDSATDHV